MKVLLVAPQSSDTVLGMIGIHCKNALKNLGYETEVFDFRQSQFLKSSLGRVLKKFIKKFIRNTHQVPFVRSAENEKMNLDLLNVVEEVQPDIMLVLMGDGILPKTLQKVKQFHITTVNWFHDYLLAPICKKFVEDISRYYDYFLLLTLKKL
ncbi:MAG: hypothetical protein QME68_06590 [Elusimicrobiota bacterium]|nr:hypothetical protein [Elusimicrobiota bacterium]